jgi:hypothetical protein
MSDTLFIAISLAIVLWVWLMVVIAAFFTIKTNRKD